LRIQETDWQRQEFETLSYRDALTGLANRRQFEKRLHDLALQPSRRRGLLHLMLIDCDKFKRVNDTRGHQAGDALLGLLGQVIRSAVREEDDLPFRLGGDEFGVLFVCPDTQAALAIGERIRTIFKESNGYGCTLSIGLAPFEPTGGHPAELQEIMAQADAALYTAKRAGGDRIAIELPAAECGTPLIPGQAPPNAA
jgi:diguanylate cyclase (GGDEF)-like protein